jgi:hypothetical protein
MKVQKKIESFSILGYLLELPLQIWQIEKKNLQNLARVWALLKSYFSAQNLAKNHQK